MPVVRSFLRLFAAFCLLVTAGGAEAGKLLFVGVSPVSPGKFVTLSKIAGQAGLELEARFVEKISVEAGPEWFVGAEMVIFDTPREHMEELARARLAKALPVLAEKRVPTLWMHTQIPRFEGLPEVLGKRLHAYYVNGGRSNFERFFQSIAAFRAGRDWAAVAAPIVFPNAAIYHPQAPGLVFANLPDYLVWKKVDPVHKPPVVAVAIHQQYIASEQTAFVHDLIARIEAAGALPLVFYSPVMEQDAISRMLKLKETVFADVLINNQIMLNAEGRRIEFAALSIPVVHATSYRKGDAAAWAGDPQGIAVMDIPFYLAQAEYAGVTDIQIAAAMRSGDEQVVAIPEQLDAVVNKALNLVKLQRKTNAEKKLAVFFWNYPPGEKNLSASFMNLPSSLSNTLLRLKMAGYTTEAATETDLINLLQRTLSPYYRNHALEELLRDGLAELLPVSVYRQWLERQPAGVARDIEARFGAPEKSAMVVRRAGMAYFVIPRLKLGHVVILPQPPRGERWEDQEKALYHSTKAPASHFYLAVYLWARQTLGADAFVHFGTHGTQEWLPGKERGLSVFDYPMLAVGDVPVIYPYIVDNIGEATQAKRRGRATIISHQTPPFAPAGLHDALTRIHDQLHAWLAQDEGVVKEKIKAEFLVGVRKERIDRDLGWDEKRLQQDFAGFVNEVHDHLHELARTAQPLGLHTFGQGPEERWRLATVLSMLGKPFWEALTPPGEEADEMLVGDYKKLPESEPYRVLRDYVQVGRLPAGHDQATRTALEQGKQWYTALGAQNELEALLSALDGRHIPTSYGGDPIKNPDALPTGRNLYGFDPSRVPTSAAWEAGKEAMEKLLATHRQKTGKSMTKLTFSLWSVETMRHFGLLEAQALWALGVEPVWDNGGRVSDVRLVPRERLGRPRVDIVLSATGLYRDHFPNTMKILAKAVKLAAEAREDDNPVAANSQRIAAGLQARGWSTEAARNAGQTRIFSSESGRYGTGLDDATLATGTWKGKAEGDHKLAQLYLSRMQFAYGPDEGQWGKSGSESSPGGDNLYAEHLKGTEGAVLSRTSNLYGMLTTDDPFQYLGGIALAVRQLDGKAPELYISNLRGNGSGRVEGAAQFLAKELATRNFHPGYIEGLMKEGYAGTLQVLDGMNNFWGWQATAREIVRDDQWQEFVDVYVRDKHRLGLKQWFETKNPHALAQTMERMLEAARQGYWQADAGTVQELKARYRDLARRFNVHSDNPAFEGFVGQGYGLQASTNSRMAATQETGAQQAKVLAPPPPPLQGVRLERVESPELPTLSAAWLGACLLMMASLGGGLRAARAK